jgi:hypothetical protein
LPSKANNERWWRLVVPAPRQEVLIMTIRRRGYRKFSTGTSWLWLISLVCLSGRCLGETYGSYDGFEYSLSGTNITITGYTTNLPGAVTIPSSVPGVNGTVTSIGDNAFVASGTLTGVTIPSSVTSIGDWAFDGCSRLTGITIPGSVTNIGDGAFSGCSHLTAFAVDTQNRFYSSFGGVLFDKNQTTLVTWPPGETGAYAIPGSVTSIGEGAFDGCSGLTSVTVPDSVTSIGESAFQGCNGLTSVTIPGSVTNIGDDAFASCGSLTALGVDTQNPSYSSLGGVLFDKNQTTLIQYPGAMAGAYTIPSSVTSIGDGAFYQCSRLTGLTIPNSVTSIGDYAFFVCGGLTSVTIPSGVASIGERAFAYCVGLTNVTIPSSVTSIGGYAFWVCGRLSSITIPNGVTSIAYGAFYECGGLTNVTIPSSVTNIGDDAFSGCNGLTTAYFQGNAPPAFGAEVFASTAPGFTIYYPSTASGWSTPTWNGYPAQPYPFLNLTLGSGVVTPSFNYLLLRTNYQLQISTDLSTWSNTGPVFTATNASAAYPQPFNVRDWNRLFFRLVSAP